MKRIHYLFPILISLVGITLLTSCNRGKDNLTDLEVPFQLSATLTNLGSSDLQTLTLASGTLAVNNALLRLDDFEFDLQLDGMAVTELSYFLEDEAGQNEGDTGEIEADDEGDEAYEIDNAEPVWY